MKATLTFLIGLFLPLTVAAESCPVAATTTHQPQGVGYRLERTPACHVISVGISQYQLGKTNLGFSNATNDARGMLASIREAYWPRKLADLRNKVVPRRNVSLTAEERATWNYYKSYVASPRDSLVILGAADSLRLVSRRDSIMARWFFAHTLLDEQATADNIVKAFGEVIRQAGPDDTFIFDFAGYTITSPITDETLFVPYSTAPLSDTTQLLKASIPLRKLREMMEYVKARNQLVVIEASYSEQFAAELTQLLTETDPRKAEVLDRNRVMVIPSFAGADNTFCRDGTYANGPLHHFLIALRQTSLFDLFTKPRDVMLDVWRQEMDCSLRTTGTAGPFYTQFIVERDLIRTALRWQQKPKTRGGKVGEGEPMKQAKLPQSRHAILIGTDRYRAEKGLKTPLNDVRAVGQMLVEDYGFTVQRLENQPKDSIMAALVQAVRSLDSTSQLLVYVAGHGNYDPTFDEGYLVFTDSKPTRQDPYLQSYLLFGQLENLLNNAHSRQVMLMLDVCFGGTFERRILEKTSVLRSTKPDEATEAQRQTIDYATRVLRYYTRQLITSGGKNEVPDFLNGASNSPFNQQIQRLLLSRGGTQQFLTATNLFAGVQSLNSGPLRKGFGRHEPQGEFVLLPIQKQENTELFR
ncbi:caspase family protein [Fibrella sp. WM1]|uniref:caspase family protein n=1 Tax=Fibrella musci TaxID=3242485 RepID=UPI0035210707